MVILGIDPGFAITGYAFIKTEAPGNKITVLDYGCVKTSASQSLSDRLFIIYEQITELIKKNKPNKIAIEKIFFARNMKTAMAVSEARGVISLIAGQHNLPLIELTPLQVKQSLTGYGQATKQQIQKMVKMILKLKEIPRPDDVADALAIALTASMTKNF
jgi:crossover junction endodeoxyribonuclease RuvC